MSFCIKTVPVAYIFAAFHIQYEILFTEVHTCASVVWVGERVIRKTRKRINGRARIKDSNKKWVIKFKPFNCESQ